MSYLLVDNTSLHIHNKYNQKRKNYIHATIKEYHLTTNNDHFPQTNPFFNLATSATGGSSMILEISLTLLTTIRPDINTDMKKNSPQVKHKKNMASSCALTNNINHLAPCKFWQTE
jgi:hypothetical protein